MSNPGSGKEDAGRTATDDAWKVFSLVNDWIRHADNKVGVTLAASAAVGVMLYNLVRALPRGVSGCTYIAPAVCGVLLVLTVVFCTFALNPRIKAADSVDDPRTLTTPNHLYFGTIVTWSREKYVAEFVELTADPEALAREIAGQVHVNAKIATEKMTATKRAVYALSSAVAALAVTAVVVIFHV
ncbi:Pycsar system effector family protein [Rhodococcus sp. IEGM 1406]|jgi:hypothetical protein|uniref:Pycsar system effector family protein n=1 Tax=Rhodococcus sp. IEGM 1406 TaxID=3047083 RepID=UPI0024B6A3CD|nr:Pycsar system effector family protein [Rhodococcus sp. IEGM 1406]MDI9909369.1 DUF5706 domain-containing protein [Rhodococcus sp. IEGM 1406]